MVLPTGTISMSQVNVELGLASTTTISLNQTNVRALAGIASGTISMNDLRGKSAVLDTFTLTAAAIGVTPTKGSPYTVYGFVSPSYTWIASSGGNGGSLSDGTFAVTSSAILSLYVSEAFAPSLEFSVDGVYSNTGWTSMTIYHNYSGTTTTVNRADMSHYNLSSDTQWFKDMSNMFSNVTAGQNTYLITIT